jgi:hypothetical protein
MAICQQNKHRIHKRRKKELGGVWEEMNDYKNCILISNGKIYIGSLRAMTDKYNITLV